MNRRWTIGAAAAAGLLSIGLFLSTAHADTGSPTQPRVTPTAVAEIRSPRPFDPKIDRLGTDSTPHLNLVGRPGVVLPNLCEQRAKSGFGGQPWTVRCGPSPTP
jgi:hypothetical protein